MWISLENSFRIDNRMILRKIWSGGNFNYLVSTRWSSPDPRYLYIAKIAIMSSWICQLTRTALIHVFFEPPRIHNIHNAVVAGNVNLLVGNVGTSFADFQELDIHNIHLYVKTRYWRDNFSEISFVPISFAISTFLQIFPRLQGPILNCYIIVWQLQDGIGILKVSTWEDILLHS